MGQSYTDFLNHLRLQAACNDLAETDKPIIEVAFESGFSQLAFFYRYFRRQMGCSPKVRAVDGPAKGRQVIVSGSPGRARPCRKRPPAQSERSRFHNQQAL
jgi:AraC-like DNA-binding protein